MSVHSTYYEDPEEYERDLRWEYRKENMPFYDDDPDIELYSDMRCEKCKYCKEYKIRERIIKTHPEYHTDNRGIRHENHKIYINYITTGHEMESVWLCEIDHCEHYDDDYCDKFENKKDITV